MEHEEHLTDMPFPHTSLFLDNESDRENPMTLTSGFVLLKSQISASDSVVLEASFCGNCTEVQELIAESCWHSYPIELLLKNHLSKLY